jgi:hypothetical protein
MIVVPKINRRGARIKVLLYCGLLGLLLGGCSHTLMLTPTSSARDFARANRHLRNWEGTVLLRSGVTYTGNHFRTGPDSTQWMAIEPELSASLRSLGFAVEPPKKFAFSSWDVYQIRVTNSFRGMRDGLAFGLMGGLAVGAVLEISAPRHHSNTIFAGTESPGGRLLISTVAGTIVGSVIGTLVGSPSTIRFVPIVQ